MAVITLVCRESVADALNAIAQDENNGDLFSAGLAPENDPQNQVARWARWNTNAYTKQPQRTLEGGEWNLHKTLAADPRIGAQIADQNGWTDDKMEFSNQGQVVLLAYRNKSNPAIQDDIEIAFGVKLVPVEIPEP